MLAATHAAFSTALYLGGAAVFEYPTDPVSWGLAMLFSLMPDIDLPISKVGRPLFFISVPLEKRFGHRTITHSIIGVAILVVIGFTAVFHLSAVLLVGCRRLLVPYPDRHGQYPGRGFVLAVADPRGHAWQDQVPAGGRQQGGNDRVMLDAGVLRGIVPDEQPWASWWPASNPERLRNFL